jgi:hypothetical protein
MRRLDLVSLAERLDELHVVHEVDAPAETVATPWPIVAPEALHGAIGDFVRLMEPQTEADPAALLASVLVGFGNLIGRSAHVVVEGDLHFGNLFCVLTGETSRGRKGTSWGRARAVLERVEPEWAPRILTGASSGEGLIWAVRDGSEPTGPKDAGDPGVADKRLLLHEGEFANVLRVCERQGNSLSALLRLAWDRGDLATLTKNSPARATDAHISMLGHVTVDELRRTLNGTETQNGFGNRILWCLVRRSKLLPFGGSPVDLVPVVDRLAAAARSAKARGAVAMNTAARDLWRESYPALTADRPGLVGALTARQEAQAIRLALVYAQADDSPVIRPEHLVAALAVVDYTTRSVEFIFGNRTGDDTADEILRALRGSPAGLSRTELRDLFGRHRGAHRIGAALDLLSGSGLARVERTATAGRPLEVWRAA